MKNILFIAFVVLSMTLLLLMQLDSENQIEEMHKELNNYENIIDSLYKKIDTLNKQVVNIIAEEHTEVKEDKL